MNNNRKVEFTYDQYTGFIQSVVNAVIRNNGIEYLRFWEILIFKMIFENYKPAHILENGSIDINSEWEEIGDYDIYSDLIVAQNIVSEMHLIIVNKLNNYFNKSDLEKSIVKLIDRATDYVEELKVKLDNADLNESLKGINALNDKLENFDRSEIARIFAKHAVEANDNEDNKDNVKLAGE